MLPNHGTWASEGTITRVSRNLTFTLNQQKKASFGDVLFIILRLGPKGAETNLRQTLVYA